MPNTTYTATHIAADEFEDVEFLKHNIEFVRRYAELRAKAINSHIAFRRVFGAINCDQSGHARIQSLESSEIYNQLLAERLKALPIDELLNSKMALHACLEIIRNPMSKDTAKIAALKEACLLANITTVEDTGKTRLGGSLDDFYRSVERRADTETTTKDGENLPR